MTWPNDPQSNVPGREPLDGCGLCGHAGSRASSPVGNPAPLQAGVYTSEHTPALPRSGRQRRTGRVI